MFLDSVWCFSAYEAVENKREGGGGGGGEKKASLFPYGHVILKCLWKKIQN